jgi:alpha-beta hydrolase superfamily lysophospholipase
MGRVLRRALAVSILLGAAAVATAGAVAGAEQACIATNARFRTADGAMLQGAVLGRGKTGVVFAHQLDGDRCQWLDFARELRGKGYRALVFDMRGYGSSSGLDGTHPDRDVVAAAKELRRRGAAKVVLVGASMGATGVVAAAPAVKPPVAGVVELSAPTAFGGVSALDAAKRLRSPALFVAGRDDGAFAIATRELYRAALTKDKKLIVAPSPLHGVDLLGRPAVKMAVLAFIDRVG